jgi:hypothetical protein
MHAEMLPDWSTLSSVHFQPSTHLHYISLPAYKKRAAAESDRADENLHLCDMKMQVEYFSLSHATLSENFCFYLYFPEYGDNLCLLFVNVSTGMYITTPF